MTGQPLAYVALLTGLALLPFALITLTSFTKIVVVLGILRNAIGAPQIPPTTVITGLALVLTGYVMAPTAVAMYEASKPTLSASALGATGAQAVELATDVATRAKEPLRGFLERHAHPRDRALFRELAARRGGASLAPAGPDGFSVLAPAFLISQLREAFTIGFLLFVPFLVIDLVVSNLLLALGMQMLQPATIAMPFKLLLFVMVDGWHLLARGLVLGYQ